MMLSPTATVLIERYKPRLTLDLGQVAEVLGMHPQSLRNKIAKSGAESLPFKVRKIGQGNWQVSIASLGAFLDGEVTEETIIVKPTRGRRRMQERFAEFLFDLNKELAHIESVRQHQYLDSAIKPVELTTKDSGGL